MKRFMYTGLVISFFITLFVDAQAPTYITGLFVIGSIAASIHGARTLYQVIGAMFVTLSFAMFLFTDIPIIDLPLYFTSTVSVVALLYMLPFINNVFRIGRYDMNIRRLLTLRMRHFGQLYTKSMFASYLMSVFLFFAALPLIYDVISKQVAKLPDKARKMFVSQSLLRGFTAAEVWSPMEVLVVVALDLTGVNYLYSLPFLLLLSAIYFFAASWRGKRYARYALDGSVRTDIAPSFSAEHEIAVAQEQPADHEIAVVQVQPAEHEIAVAKERPAEEPGADAAVVRSIAVMLIAMVGLITVTALLHHITEISFLAAITVVVLPYALLWALLIKRFRSYVRYSLLAWGKKTDGIQNIALLFLTLGLFNSMAEASGVLEMIQQPFVQISHLPLILFFAVQICTLLFSLLGFHPLVSVSLFGLVMQPLLGEIAPLSVAIVLLTSGLATASSGAFNTSVNITADLLKINPYQISWWNLRYALFIGTMGTLLAFLLNVML